MSSTITSPENKAGSQLRTQHDPDSQMATVHMRTDKPHTEPAEKDTTAIVMEDLSSWYGSFQALKSISQYTQKQGHCVHRSQWLWQKHIASLDQSHE